MAEPRDFSETALALLRTAGTVELRSCDRDALRLALTQYDAIWVQLRHRIDAAMLDGQPVRCRLLAVPTTGLDHVDLDACARHGVAVLSLRGESEFLREVRATAELTVGLALALLRHIPAAAAAVRAGTWDRDRFRGHELHGKVAGIVGMGRLGTIVAGYLSAFGMRVVGFDPRPDYPAAAAERAASLPELLGMADVVTLHLPYGPDTHGTFGEAEFAAMKPGAILVNTARGGIVREAALLASLESGRLGGAALDVLSGEPDVGADHPVVRAMARHDNLILVPHIGGNTFESFEKTQVFLARRVVQAMEAMR